MSNRPGGELAKRPLQFFWLCDCSGSMAGSKIQQLNFAIREAIPAMIQVAQNNPNVTVHVRAITFSNGAQWHIGTPTPVEQFVWSDLSANGFTDMGRAIDLLCDALETSQMPERGLPPVCVLIGDGQPTDNIAAPLERMVRLPWGARSVRVAIAIGDDADLDALQQFMGGDSRERSPLIAKNAPDLVKYIKWVSTVPLQAVSRPRTTVRDGQSTNVIDLPPPPPPGNGSVDPTEPW